MVQRTKNLPGRCQHCGGGFEFPAEGAGTMADCPHCGKPTELMLERPPEEPVISQRMIVWMLVAAVIFVLGVGACIYAYHQADSMLKAKRPQPAASTPPGAK
jgi:hypothetical protein